MQVTKRIVLTSPGNHAKFTIQEGEKPALKNDDDVLIDVHYSGLNFADVMMRLKLYPDAPKAPFTPGYEISGVVVAIGDAMHGFSVGDEVMGGCFFGGYSSQVVLPAWQVKKVPAALTMIQAGGLMVSYLTAAFALFELARVRPEEHVVIDCGSGALGAVMIKLLRHHGVSRITGLTRSEQKTSIIENLGAKGLTHEQWGKSSQSADIFINSRGGQTVASDLSSLAPLGRMVCLGASNLVSENRVSLWKVVKEFVAMELLGRPSVVELMNKNNGVFGLNVLTLFNEPEKIQKLLSDEFFVCVAPQIDEVFSYTNIEEAHKKLGSGKSSGKILLSWKN